MIRFNTQWYGRSPIPRIFFFGVTFLKFLYEEKFLNKLISMKNKIMQLVAPLVLGGVLILASCMSPSEKTGEQDTTATPIDSATTLDIPADSAATQSVQDSSSVSK